MNTSTKFILSSLTVIISIFICMMLANGENVTNTTNATIDPNATIPTQTTAPNVTAIPIATVTIPTSVSTQNVSVDITPNITVAPIVTAATPTINPNVTVIPVVAVSVQAPVATPVITAGQNTTIVSVPVINDSVTQETISKVVPETVDTHKTTHSSKKKPGNTRTDVPIYTTVVPTATTIASIATTVTSTNGSDQNSFLGDISGKVIIAAILGFIGLLYEIIKIKYEHRQKAKAEQISEETQNKLLEKLERRQEILLAQHGISDKRQDASLDKTDKQQEDINDQNNNV